MLFDVPFRDLFLQTSEPMWLLSTDRAELHWFPSPEEVPDGFATLSHVWDKTEQSFQDVRRIQKRCAKNGTNPRRLVCGKIRRCCELAESHGYKWVWIDTCCIDKTSSTELSEAINSMFRYYALSRICYGYLRDVERPEEENYGERGWYEVTFLQSIWFKRGWTLQELIAPRFFLFVSKSWEVLRSKADFAEYLERATRIPAAVLRLEISHTTYSISQRMSWFGWRETTRLEDEAYCLLGIFDIHMAPLYGEGRNAFRRLQEEIMKQSVDTTLFAWQPSAESRSPWFNWDTCSCLLAPSPTAFQQLAAVAYIPLHHVWSAQLPPPNSFDDHKWDIEGAHDMSFSVTPHGIQAYIPIIRLKGDKEEAIFADLAWCQPENAAIPHRVLLPLEEDPDSRAGLSSRRESYIVGRGRLTYAQLCKSRGMHHISLWLSTESLTYMMFGHKERASRTWRTVLIRDRPPPHRLPGQPSSADPHIPLVPVLPSQLFVGAPFRFDELHVQKFFHIGIIMKNIQRPPRNALVLVYYYQ
ncbi:heterokaryon incompatibility protein-domain-containing protein [Cerioporus squamosus]|nr:heterokaryon incompatibility protein-domain-containing protein [Cerioporus squamosus]